jgi:hypothetical protein
MFFTRSVWQLRDATIELLEVVFSMRYVPRCYKQDKFRVWLVEDEACWVSRVEAESNTTTVALCVIGGDEK